MIGNAEATMRVYRTVFLVLGCLFASAALNSTVCAQTPRDELRFSARLIWGTDGEKPQEEGIQDLDASTLKRLRAVFRWKNYFEICRREFAVAPAGKERVRMSKKCEVEVRNEGGRLVEVLLFGEEKLVVKKRQTIKPGELLVLAGDDKNKTAWFVILSLQEPEER